MSNSSFDFITLHSVPIGSFFIVLRALRFLTSQTFFATSSSRPKMLTALANSLAFFLASLTLAAAASCFCFLGDGGGAGTEVSSGARDDDEAASAACSTSADSGYTELLDSGGLLLLRPRHANAAETNPAHRLCTPRMKQVSHTIAAASVIAEE